MQLNKVLLIGFAGGDAKVLEKAVKLSIATSNPLTKKPDWHQIVAFNKLMDVAKTIKKGDMVFIEGSISYGEYNDKPTVSIIASTVQKLISEEEIKIKAKNLKSQPADTSVDPF